MAEGKRKPLPLPQDLEGLTRAVRDAQDQREKPTVPAEEMERFTALAQEVFDTLNTTAGQQRFLLAEIITQSVQGGENSVKSVHTTPQVPVSGEYVIGETVDAPSYFVMQESTRFMDMYIAEPSDDARIGCNQTVRTTLLLQPAKDVQPIPILDMEGIQEPGSSARVTSVTTYTSLDQEVKPSQLELLNQGNEIANGIRDYFQEDTASCALMMDGVPGHGLVIQDAHKPSMNIERFVPHISAA